MSSTVIKCGLSKAATFENSSLVLNTSSETSPNIYKYMWLA